MLDPGACTLWLTSQQLHAALATKSESHVHRPSTILREEEEGGGREKGCDENVSHPLATRGQSHHNTNQHATHPCLASHPPLNQHMPSTCPTQQWASQRRAATATMRTRTAWGPVSAPRHTTATTTHPVEHGLVRALAEQVSDHRLVAPSCGKVQRGVQVELPHGNRATTNGGQGGSTRVAAKCTGAITPHTGTHRHTRGHKYTCTHAMDRAGFSLTVR